MRTLLIACCLMLLTAFTTKAEVSRYSIDDEKIEALFSQSQVVDVQSFAEVLPASGTQSHNRHGSYDKDPVIAWLICTFVGALGVHRYYLGTDPLVVIAYALTCGGCGIVVFVDWIVLIMGILDDDISPYIDNPRFIMWD